MRQQHRSRHAFTLIELLVVIAIIALLIGILLPALGAARRSAWTTIALNNARQVNLGVVTYTAESKDYYPPSYVYPATDDVTDFSWRLEDQRSPQQYPQRGYIHWSYALFGNGEVPEEAFESPALLNGGAPRTNPGPNEEDWENQQVNALDVGYQPGNQQSAVTDRQVRRVAFGGNHAIFPRNKFNQVEVGGRRQNILVRDAVIEFPAQTILIAEFTDAGGWRAIQRSVNTGVGGGNNEDAGAWQSGSHRPITPFIGWGADDIYDEIDRGGRASFRYHYLTEVDDEEEELINAMNGPTPINVVSREHSDKAVFGYTDGHAELKTLKETIKNTEWGRRFYSLSGYNDVDTPAELEEAGVWEE